MSFIILSSVALRLLALGWALVLLARLRDWRMAFLAAMLALMALRQTLTGLQGFDRELLVFTAQLEELPGLIVSVLAFLAVFYVGRLVEEQQGEKAALRRSRDDLREVLDALPALVGYVDKDQRYLSIERRCSYLFQPSGGYFDLSSSIKMISAASFEGTPP